MQHAILSWQSSADSRNQTISHEGGIVQQVDALTVVRRFLILGSTGTFYANAFDVTRMATGKIDAAIADDPRAVLDLVCEVSRGNLALRKDPQLYVLAKLTEPTVPLDVRRDAAMAVATVARTGTDLLHWLAYRYAGRKSNRLFRRAIANWFLSRTPDELALQAVKYDQRDGWALRDALRLAKPKAPNAEYAAVFDWIAHPDKRHGLRSTRLFDGYMAVRRYEGEGAPSIVAELIGQYRLPREAVPGEMLAHREVWAALFPDMPGRALLRNLGKLGSLGFFDAPETIDLAIAKIERATHVCHPFEFLVAAKMYDQGHGVRGSLSWTPNAQITNALANGFGAAFNHLTVNDTIAPLIAMDISGSMSQASGGTVLSCVEAESALVSVLAYQFPRAQFVAYAHQLAPVQVHGVPYQDLLGHLRGLAWHMGATDCALPIRVAAGSPETDAVLSITDSETWTRESIPALVRSVQAQPGRDNFRHGVIAMATNDISIADASDPRQMDFVGLDASMPQAVALFLRGEA